MKPNSSQDERQQAQIETQDISFYHKHLNAFLHNFFFLDSGFKK